MVKLGPVEHMVEVKSYRITQHCPNDGAELVSKGYIYPMAPPRYPYMCPACEFEATFSQSYPSIEYR